MILIAQYLALSGLVGAYFAQGKKGAKSCFAFEQVGKLLFLAGKKFFRMSKNVT